MIYLRDVSYTYIYPNNINSPFLHRHIIWCSQFFIKQLQKTRHIYIDGTFVFPCEFKQLIVILFYESITEARYPGAYILLNSKYYQSYLIAFNAFKNIITKYNSIKINIESITVDFEEGLINSLTQIFIGCRIIGCFYHYMSNIEKNAKRFGLYKKNRTEIRKYIKVLAKIPFLFQKNQKIVDDCFEYIKKSLKKKFRQYKFELL